MEEERKVTQMMKNSMLMEMERLVDGREADRQKYIMKKNSYIMLQDDYNSLDQKYEAERQKVRELEERIRNLENLNHREKEERRFCQKKLESFERKDRQFLNSIGSAHRNLKQDQVHISNASMSSSSLLLKLQQAQLALLESNEEKDAISFKYEKMEKQMLELVPDLAKLKRMQEVSSQAYNSCLIKYQKILKDKGEMKKEMEKMQNEATEAKRENMQLSQENKELQEKIKLFLESPKTVLEEVQSLSSMKIKYELQIQDLKQKMSEQEEHSKRLEDSYKEKIETFEERVKELEEGQKTLLVQKIERLASAYEEGRRTSSAKDVIAQIIMKLPSLESQRSREETSEEIVNEIDQNSQCNTQAGQKENKEKLEKSSEFQIASLQTELSKIKKALKEAEANEKRQVQRNNHLQGQMKSLTKKYSEQSKKKLELVSELQKVKIEVEKLSLSHQYLKSQLKLIEQENKELRKQKEQLMTMSIANISIMKEQRSMVETESIRKFKQIQKEFNVAASDQANKQIQEELLLVKIKNSNTKAVIKSLREKLQIQIQRNNKVWMKIEEIKAQLTQEFGGSSEEALDELLKYLQNFKEPENELKEQSKKKGAEIKKLKLLIKEQQRNFEELVEAHQDLLQKVEEKAQATEQENGSSLEEIKEKLAGLKESELKFEEEKQKLIGQLSQQNLKLVEELSTSKKQREELVEKNGELEEKIGKLNQKLNLISSSLMQQKQGNNEEEVISLKKQILELKQSSTIHQENLRILNKKNKDIQENLKRSEEEYESLKEQSAKKQNNMQERIVNLEKEIDTYCSTIEQLNEGKEDPMSKLVQMFKDKEKQSQANYRELQIEYETYKEQKNQEESIEEEGQVSEEEGNNEELEKELERTKEKYRELERQNLVLKKQVGYLSKGTSNEDGQVSVQIKKLLGIVTRARRLNQAYQDLFAKNSLLKRRGGSEREGEEEVEPEKEKRMKID